jgi:MYXO-CTERM domain-containing protein/uncharacterized repeat protein (TIGR01451 family)
MQRRTPFAVASVLAALLGTTLTPLSAAAQTPEACLRPGAVVTQATLRFNAAAPGNIVATGNALGLAKADATNGPGTFDSIGTFIALDPTDVDASPAPGWFAGTTNDWTLNGSSAELALPAEVEILYAELVWGGSWADPNGVGSIAASLEDSVRLIADGDEVDVAPEGAGIDVSLGTLYRYYARSADVTDFLRSHGEATYTVAGVPSKQTDSINSLHAAGWTLFVAYRDPQEPIRNLSIFFGGEFVDENTSQDYGFADFCASSAGDLTGRAIITALEGDANRAGDVLCIAPGENPANDDFVGLEGPNNPADNFFASQINDASGELDVSGTFGDRNHDAANTANVSGGRQGWDITQIDLSSADGSLAPGQTGAVLRTATLSDSYLPMAAGFAIDVTAPAFPAGPGTATTISADEVALGDTFTISVTLTNDGPVAAEEIGFRLILPSGIALDGFTSDGEDGDIDGNPVDAGDLSAGVDEGTLASGAVRVVELTLRVDGPPPGSTFFFQPLWAYEWVMCDGEPSLSESFAGQGVSAAFDDQGATSAQSTGNGSGGAGGDSGSGGSPGPAGPGAGGGEAPSTSAGPTVASSAVSSSASGPSAGPGPAGSGGAGDGDGDGDAGDGGGNGFADDAKVTEAEGCGCSAPGGSPDASWPLAALALALVGWRRRRSG